MKGIRILLLSLLMTGGFLHGEEIPLTSEKNLKSWKKTIQGGSREDGFVQIRPTAEDLVKGKGLLGIWRPVVFKQLAGRDAILSVEMMLDNVSALPNRKFSGSKFMVHFRRGGKVIYRGTRDHLGSAPWKMYEFRFTVPDDGRFNISLGMQAKGTVRVRNLQIRVADCFVDFSGSANMGFADAKEKDGTGGWSDQGPENDAAGFDFRKNSYSGVPFRVTDPAKNNGKSVLTFGSVNFPKGIRSVRIPVAGSDGMKMLYLLHTACWAPGSGNAGTILLKGEKGEQKIPVRFKVDLGDQWNPSHLKNALVGAVWNNRTGGSNGLYVSRFPVKPEIGKIREIQLAGGETGAVWIIAGITLSGTDFPRPKTEKFVVRAGERFRALKRPPTPQILPGSALDFSELNTGKIERIIINRHGRLAKESAPEEPFRFFAAEVSTSLNDHYVAQDNGKKKLNARAFWKDKNRISQLVQEIRRHGCNMVRLHSMDMVTVTDGVATLNSRKLDLWDWCVAECKKNGIYIQIDTMHVQGFSKFNQWMREGQARNAKFQLLFNNAMREEYRIGMKAFLDHVNPYTKTALRDDPVLAVLNYCNEQEFAFINTKFPWDAALPEWRKFIGDPNAPMFTRKEWNTRNEKGKKINAFITMKWREMLAWYRKTIHQEIGYKGLANLWEMTSSMHYNVLRNDLDYVMMHTYHAHAIDCTKQAQGSDIGGGLKQLRTLLDARIAGRPFLVNEYASVYWNRYRYEEPFAVGAYAAFQGFDMLLRHGSPIHVVNGERIFPWIMFHDPICKASLAQTALLYGRGDVQEGKRGVRLTFSEKAVSDNMIWSDALNSMQSRLSLIARFGLEQTDPSPALRPPAPADDLRIPLLGGAQVVENTQGFASSLESKAGSFSLADQISVLRKKGIIDRANRSNGAYVFENSTRELYVDTARNYMSVNTPRFQGLCGEETAKAELRDVSIELLKTRGIVSVASLRKEKPIVDSDRLLLTYATNALCSNMTFENDSMMKVLYYGENPTMIETGRFRVRIRNKNADKLKLYPLLMNGKRCAPVKPLSTKNGTFVAEIDTATLPEGPALFFELAE